MTNDECFEIYGVSLGMKRAIDDMFSMFLPDPFHPDHCGPCPRCRPNESDAVREREDVLAHNADMAVKR